MTKKNNKKTVAEIVTQRFIDALEKDNIPWIKPWEHWTSWSRNTGDDYQGVNIANLSGGEYVTFKQAQEEGIKINKGAKSEIIVKYTNYMKTINKEDLNKAENIARYRADEIEDLGNGKVKVPARSIRYYNVFNVKECTDAEEKHEHTQEAHEWDPIDKADQIVKGYINASGLKSTTASNQPLYDSAAHRVELGRPEQFMTAEAYYSTAFHELIHSTAKALNRNCSAYHVSKPARAREELVAEIGAAYIMSYLGIEDGYSINNSEAYVKSWIKNLKNDPNAILWAAPKAIEAAELILAAGK